MTNNISRRSFLKRIGEIALVGAAALTGCERKTAEEQKVNETIKAFHTYVNTLTKEEVNKQLNALDDFENRQREVELDKLWDDNSKEKADNKKDLTAEQTENQALRKKLRDAILQSTNGRADIAKQHWRNIYRTTLAERAESFSSQEKENARKKGRSKEPSAAEMAQTMKILMQNGR